MKNRIEYVWTYYKLRIMACALIVCLSIYFMSIFLSAHEEHVLSVQFVNCISDISEDSAFCKECAEYCDVDPLELVFDANAFFDLSNSSDFANTYYLKMVAELDSGKYDAVICDRINFDAIAESGRFMSLDDERLEGLIQKYSDRIIYVEDGSIPVGISLSACSRIEQIEDTTDEYCIGINSLAPHAGNEIISDFIDFLIMN